jgi:mevalonate pyrophosphate decarboxylase
MAILTYLRGGKPRNVPYNKKYVSNVMTAIRQEDKSNDMMKVLDYFRKRKEEDPRFYYSFERGPGNKVLSIFWSDGFSR